MKKFAVLISILLLAASAFAEELRFETSIDKPKVSLGESLTLGLTFHNIENISAPDLPEIEDFQSSYLGPSTVVSVSNGQAESSITHKYRLVPLREGAFTIGPFSFDYQGTRYTSEPIKLKVVSPQSVSASGDNSSQTIDLSDRIFLVIEPQRQKLYLNEIISFRVRLYVNELAVSDEQIPELPQDGFLVDWQEKLWHRDVLDGVAYRVLEYRGNLTAIKTGEFLLGPASINCNLVIRRNQSQGQSSFFGGNFFDNFFNRYDKHPLDIKSAAVLMQVSELPRDGKPDNFNGAIGDFNFSLKVSPKKVRVGDPITLAMRISGEGNFDALSIPLMELEDDFKVYDAQVRGEDKAKVFEQILMPKNDKVTEIPRVIFSFFNPQSGEYEVLNQGPVPIEVTASQDPQDIKILEYSGNGQIALSEESLGKGIIYIKETIGSIHKKGVYLYKSKVFIFMLVLPLLLLAGFLIIQARFSKIKSDLGYARSLKAPKNARRGLRMIEQSLNEGNREKFYNNVFKTLKEYLGDKFGLPVAGITIDIVDQVLELKGIDREILQKIKELFNDCDVARYAPSSISKEKMKDGFQKMSEIIDHLQKKKI